MDPVHETDEACPIVPPLLPSGPRRAAFTLVELLTVLGILAVLAALWFPLSRNARQRAGAALCVTQLRGIGVAVHLFSQQNDGVLPPAQRLNGRGLWLSAGALSSDDQAQLCYYFREVIGDATPKGQLVKSFACPTVKRRANGTWPLMYALNRRVGGTGGKPPFGFYGGQQSFESPQSLNQVLELAQRDPDPVKDQRWFLQEADQTGGLSAPWDAASFPERPAHGDRRHRLFLDGHVESLTLNQSDIR